jgi:hypothetical protein
MANILLAKGSVGFHPSFAPLYGPPLVTGITDHWYTVTFITDLNDEASQ